MKFVFKNEDCKQYSAIQMNEHLVHGNVYFCQIFFEYLFCNNKIKISVQVLLDLMLEGGWIPVFRISEKSPSTVINRVVIGNKKEFSIAWIGAHLQKDLSFPAPNFRHRKSDKKSSTCPTSNRKYSRWKITNVCKWDCHVGRGKKSKERLKNWKISNYCWSNDSNWVWSNYSNYCKGEKMICL